jgi:hypothetical protein
MRALSTSTICGTSIVAALLLAVVGCGSAGGNSALFDSSGGNALSSGGGASESFGGTSNPGAGSSSGGASNPGAGSTSGGATTGGAPAGGSNQGGGASGGGAPNGGESATGGIANGGNAGSASGGSANGGSGSGNVLSDCTAFGPDATFYSETKHCYLVVHDMATFAQARMHCSSLGAHLVTLSDQAENDFVWGLDNNEHWIGATDGKGQKETTPGTYTWVDGEPFNYTHWSPGQPNASATDCVGPGGTCYEHCAFHWNGGQWNDRYCAHTIEAVCEWDN